MEHNVMTANRLVVWCILANCSEKTIPKRLVNVYKHRQMMTILYHVVRMRLSNCVKKKRKLCSVKSSKAIASTLWHCSPPISVIFSSNSITYHPNRQSIPWCQLAWTKPLGYGQTRFGRAKWPGQ